MEYNAFNLVLGIWGFILFLFAIIEMVQLRGIFFHFSLGALAAIVCYVMNLELTVQIAAFAIVTAVSFLLLRPLFLRFARKNATVHEEGLDLLVGFEGKVIAKIDVSAGTARVEINGRPVKAVPVDPQQKYNVGDRVVVTGLDGDQLIVKKAKKRK
ncbi:MAG: NfeD family protein [Coriobacteriaceae bacterium]|nr:NfeD family protein [Coriobacteriaceae bacterium]